MPVPLHPGNDLEIPFDMKYVTEQENKSRVDTITTFRLHTGFTFVYYIVAGIIKSQFFKWLVSPFEKFSDVKYILFCGIR